MPSTSPKQHHFMEAVAHSPSFAKKAGVPQSVGKDFAKADDRAGITKTHNGQPVDKRTDHMARRKSQGLSYRKVGDEFGVSKSTAHRTLRQGFTRMGKA